MKGRKFAPVAAALIATAALAFGQSGQRVKFFNGKVEAVEWLDSAIARFNAENPGIVVEQEFQKDASTAIKVKLASGDAPDITTVYGQDYADQGVYLDLSKDPAWARLNPAVREMCTDVKTGKQFRIATNLTMAGLYYNKKVFADLGLKEAYTWADFKANLKKVKDGKPGVTPLFIAGKESWTLGHLIEFMPHGIVKQNLGTMGAKLAFLANDDAKLRFGAAGGPMDSFASRVLELVREGLVNKDALTATYDDQLSAFASGKAAMISQGMWALGGILERNPGFKDIGFSPYPSIAAGAKAVILSAEDSGYCVLSAGKNKEAALKFLAFLFRADNQKAYCELMKSPSAFKDVNADWGPLKDEVSKALKNGVNIGFTNEAPAGFSGDDAGRLVQGLFSGQFKTSMEFAKAYKDSWDKAYKASNK
jgi:raffinose/stachyose/melibiose transport system substrate-binding protein